MRSTSRARSLLLCTTLFVTATHGERALLDRNIDPVFQAMLEAVGVHLVPSAIEQASSVVEAQKLDGLLTFPTAALAFQWALLMKHFTPLPLA